MTQFASSLFWTRDECDRFIIEVSGLEKRQFANGINTRMRPISNTPVKVVVLVAQCQITWHPVIKNGCRVDYIVVMGPLFCGCVIQSVV
jgi:hypothetical protein